MLLSDGYEFDVARRHRRESAKILVRQQLEIDIRHDTRPSATHPCSVTETT
jgi:hypothetical protein